MDERVAIHDPRLGAAATPRAAGPPNHLRRLRIDLMVSKSELARRAGLSSLTVDRIERGCACRMDTKRKILQALGLTPGDRAIVFPEEEAA